MVDNGSEIVGVRQKDGAITHVAVLHPVEPIIKDVEEKGDYFTFEDGQRAKVYARTSSDGTKSLTTSRDGTKVNNLDFLLKV